MTSRKKDDPLESISIRLPPEEVTRLGLEAAAVPMLRAPYIASVVLSQVPQPWPALGALARMIAIQEAVLASGNLNVSQLAELRSIVLEFARLAHAEASK